MGGEGISQRSAAQHSTVDKIKTQVPGKRRRLLRAVHVVAAAAAVIALLPRRTHPLAGW